MDLAERLAAYTADTVNKDIRDFYKQLREALELGQEEVAEAGGASQSAISKIEGDAKYQPKLITFIKAVRGLGGMKVSEFFDKFERHQAVGGPFSASVQNRTLLPGHKDSGTTSPSHSSQAESSHGDHQLPTSAAISEDDLRAFFRILQHALGGSILEAIDRAQAGRQPASARTKRARPHKGARRVR